MVTSISCPSHRFCMQTRVGSSQVFFLPYLNYIFFCSTSSLNILFVINWALIFFYSTFYEIIMICCQIRPFNIWFFLNCFFLFYHPTFDWLRIGLQAFFFIFISMGLSQSYIRGYMVYRLTRFDSYFLKWFFTRKYIKIIFFLIF
jgi:hypothetical protein